jgi:tRNA pseudouridine55 synthase
MGGDKIYEGTFHLGVLTDSQDSDGKVIEERDAGQVTAEALRKEMSAFLGDQMQTPPMLSAIKQGGVPLYKLARKGKVVEREARLIHIFEFSLLDYTPPMAAFRLRCTKGTYVRTIAGDLGEQLGCGAHLASLRRTGSGAFRLEDALPLDALCAMTADELVHRALPVYHPSLAQPHGG